MHALWSPPGV